MGAYRDAEFFALDDVARFGRETGRNNELYNIANSLGVTPDTIKDLNSEGNLVERVKRLETIALSVGSLLEISNKRLDTFQYGEIEDVAKIIIDEQIPKDPSESKCEYYGAKNYYLLDRIEDEVVVKSGVWGGKMHGYLEFDRTDPLTGSWVDGRLKYLGVDRHIKFCESVATNIVELINIEDVA